MNSFLILLIINLVILCICKKNINFSNILIKFFNYEEKYVNNIISLFNNKTLTSVDIMLLILD
jgi:hypothetical protein